jgi:hypothetical protein
MNPSEVKEKFEELTKELLNMRHENPEQYLELLGSLTEYYKALGEGITYLTKEESSLKLD